MVERKFKFKNTPEVKSVETKKEVNKISDETLLTASLVSELMNAATSFHKLHLKVTGTGSYAAHNALKFYEDLHDKADDLVEQFQGASGKLITEYKELPTRNLNSVKEAIAYIDDLKAQTTELQSKLPYSEIINELDTLKSLLNGGKYKLLFLS